MEKRQVEWRTLDRVRIDTHLSYVFWVEDGDGRDYSAKGVERREREEEENENMESKKEKNKKKKGR